ncbi:MAG: aspartyl-tRNA(Asn)/glutamyl-tRNA(Gln) amidotransferase subunit [Candidatus Sumerlaeota bacterium]|nr:aspartyl-tRNA(Asn)/glutamyl-tRNA(Gln) amidotransferase subunit [Candidatus Sumerlaeota bacterium]
MEFEPVIGFEVHTELKTNSKVWCGCSTEFGAPPNTQVCPVCLGMPGSLPVLNRHAFDIALKVGLALNCSIPERTYFDRKNYYYPDLPKNYQISQQYEPLGRDGWFDIELPDGSCKRIEIDNLHLEEDAGKNIHPEGQMHVDYSLVDLNRAGTPLLEIVTRPDLRGKEEAEAFMRGMKAFLEYLGASDCKMQEGRLRFELNISVRPKGSDVLGQKVEVKNLNSMSVVLKCIDAEIERQSALLEQGGRVAQETRLWDEEKFETRSMRSKETAYDYRYFPDPDLVDVVIDNAMKERLAAEIPELPLARRARFVSQYGLSDYDARVLTAERQMAEYFESAVSVHNNPKTLANWMLGEMKSRLNEMGEDATADDFPVRPAALAELVRMIDDGSITGKIAKTVFPEMVASGKSPSAIVEEKGLKPLDDSALEPIVRKVMADNPKMVEDVRGGKKKAIGGLMGQIMRATQGKANPAVVTPMIERLIAESEG